MWALPSFAETVQLIVLEKQLPKYETLSHSDVWVVFDCLMEDFEIDFTHYLADDTELVINPDFKQSIWKALQGSVLSWHDVALLSCFEIED